MSVDYGLSRELVTLAEAFWHYGVRGSYTFPLVPSDEFSCGYNGRYEELTERPNALARSAGMPQKGIWGSNPPGSSSVDQRCDIIAAHRGWLNEMT